MKPGEEASIAGYALAFRGVAPATGPNYRETVGLFDVARGGTQITRLEPSKRIYDMPPQPTTEAGIHAGLARRSLRHAWRRAGGRRAMRCASFSIRSCASSGSARSSCSSVAPCRSAIGACAWARRGARAGLRKRHRPNDGKHSRRRRYDWRPSPPSRSREPPPLPWNPMRSLAILHWRPARAASRPVCPALSGRSPLACAAAAQRR